MHDATTTPLPQTGDPDLADSPYPLAFVAAAGRTGIADETERAEHTFRCEVMGIHRFQKEGLVEDTTTGRSWRLPADEGKYLKGTGRAPAPLMHWAAGLHGDVTTRIARLADASGITITDLHVTVSQGFASQGSFARGEAVGLVFDLGWDVRVISGAAKQQIEEIVTAALSSSPAHAALTRSREGTFALTTNGKATRVIGVPASTSPPEADPFRAHSHRPAPADTEAVPDGVLTILPGSTERSVMLTDNHSGTVQWHVAATGDYDFSSGLVTTAVGFPEAPADRWQVQTDASNRLAPSPLSYFAIGTAFCYHTQLCRYVDVRRMPISSPRLVQTSTFVSAATAADALPFDTHLFLRGKIDDERTRSLLVAAANTCYAHRALSVEVESTQTVSVSPGRP
ncbi:OsmC family protein [Amycolatopsis jiangsuensis]|uniref:Putative OsmC-like protein n=1 Tax=Amycolatopsis jiangsuensis TaxID=1181879 RepID=A0A840J3J5_9PSEU|nr:hypothetical protein [Amycolatopsis jiangsuensis]MBB4689646.1 putative OsmC-like protein [Amycolatopsis jiangsuensis]